jgi:fructose-bisphosphate aldolase class II
LETVVRFIEETGVEIFAPAIGNVHGVYHQQPILDFDRVEDVVRATGLPIALHGGSGLTESDLSRMISLGCAKVNISTALKGTRHRSFATPQIRSTQWSLR